MYLYIYTHTLHFRVYFNYIYVYICVCMCVYVIRAHLAAQAYLLGSKKLKDRMTPQVNFFQK